MPDTGRSSTRSGGPDDFWTPNPLAGIDLQRSTPIATMFDDELPWRATALSDPIDPGLLPGDEHDGYDYDDDGLEPTADDVLLQGAPAPAWRRVGPRGVLAIVAAVILVGVVSLQAADAWRGPGSRYCRRITASSSPEAIARCNSLRTSGGTSTSTTAASATTAAPLRTAATVAPTQPPAANATTTTVKVKPPTTRATTAASEAAAGGDAAAGTTAAPARPKTTVTNPPPEVVGTPTTMDMGDTGANNASNANNSSGNNTGGNGRQQGLAANPQSQTGNPGGTGGLGAKPISADSSINAPVGAAATNGPAGASNSVFEPLRNAQPQFTTQANVPSGQLNLNALTIPAGRPDNGPQNGEGQFRIACQYSHFSYDDPIVFPGQPGQSHLHMFFGNTNTNAFSTTDSLVNSGGGTCDGFEANRTAYWVPALLDGSQKAIVPKEIIVYYKSKYPAETSAMPQGLKLVGGNPKAETFNPGPDLHWSCGGSSDEYNISNHIPDCGGDTIKAVIEFPNCWDGKNLDSPDHRSHVTTSNDAPCPAGYPVRFPQISILLYFAGTSSVNGWHLSSDNFKGFNTAPGSTLHADWFGGWNNEVMDMWTSGCINAVRDCSYGQTGTDRQLAPISETQTYTGPTQLDLPSGSYQMG